MGSYVDRVAVVGWGELLHREPQHCYVGFFSSSQPTCETATFTWYDADWIVILATIEAGRETKLLARYTPGGYSGSWYLSRQHSSRGMLRITYLMKNRGSFKATWRTARGHIYLLSIYGKNEADDLTQKEKDYLKKMVEVWNQ